MHQLQSVCTACWNHRLLDCLGSIRCASQPIPTLVSSPIWLVAQCGRVNRCVCQRHCKLTPPWRSLHGREGAGMHERGRKMLYAGRHCRNALAPLRHPPRRLPRVVAVLRAWVAPQLHHAVQHACSNARGMWQHGVSQRSEWPATQDSTATPVSACLAPQQAQHAVRGNAVDAHAHKRLASLTETFAAPRTCLLL